MATCVELTIEDFSKSDSVLHPVMSAFTETAIADIGEVLESFKEKFKHEEPFANSTCDMVAHI